MANNKKKKNTGGVDLDLTSIGKQLGLTLLRDSDYALINNRLPTFLPQLDKILGGGFPFGRMIELYASEGAGKSTLAIHMLKVAVALNCIPVLIDVEGTGDKVRLRALGVDDTKVFVKQPDDNNKREVGGLTIELVGEMIKNVLNFFSQKYPDKPVVFIWDSVGATLSEVEREAEFSGTSVPGAKAKSITQSIGRVAPIITGKKAMLIAINQVRDDIGGMGMFKTVDTPGGRFWKHYASIRLYITKAGPLDKTENGQKIKYGHKAKFETKKSKVSTPFQQAIAYLISEKGFDYEENIIRTAVDEGFAESSGQSYIYVDDNGEQHKQRKDLFVETLKSEEGKELRRELFHKLCLHFMPNGYPALDNVSLPIESWEDAVGLREAYAAANVTNHEGHHEEVEDLPDLDELAELVEEEEQS